MKTSINNAEKEKQELDRKLVDEKGEFEEKVKESTANLENVRSKIEELVVELGDKNDYLNELKTELKGLEEIYDKNNKSFKILQYEFQQLSLDTTQKETTLSTLNKELETLAD